MNSRFAKTIKALVACALLRRRISGIGFLLLETAGSAWSAQANEKLNLALVGVGGRGSWFVGAIPRLGENLVALCDVDDAKSPDACQQLPRAGKFRDFRRMLEVTGEGIDAVIVATPDQTHAVSSAAALRAGKPVFCEKPLTRTVHESRALRELARQHQVASGMGNQGTAAGPFRRALELIRAGTIGDVKEVHIWNSEGGADRKESPGDGGPVSGSPDGSTGAGGGLARSWAGLVAGLPRRHTCLGELRLCRCAERVSHAGQRQHPCRAGHAPRVRSAGHEDRESPDRRCVVAVRRSFRMDPVSHEDNRLVDDLQSASRRCFWWRTGSRPFDPVTTSP